MRHHLNKSKFILIKQETTFMTILEYFAIN
jgi:hypothetical protein